MGVGDEETLDFRLAEVEDFGAPGLVLALAGVRVLVAGFAVELVKPVGVLREVGGDPVHDDPDAVPVALVDEVHKVCRGAVPRCTGVVTADLIAPGPVEGVLGEGHEFDVGVAHVRHIGDQFVGQGPVGEVVAVFVESPGAGVDFVNIDGPVVNAGGSPFLQPLVVVPVIAVVELVELTGGAGTGLHVVPIGVRFHDGPAVSGLDGILVNRVLLHGTFRGDALPDAVGDALHG